MFSPAFLKVQAELEKEAPGSFRKISGIRDTRRVQTGVFILDYLLGGGIPVNRIILICGHKACFKTTLALKIAANYQQLCGLCLKLHDQCQCEKDAEKPRLVICNDVEHALDEAHAIRMGIDPERFYLLRPKTGEAACEYTERLIAIPEVGCIITDSLAALVPTAELEGGYADSLARGLRARLIARMFRALVSNLDTPLPRLAIVLNHLLPQQNGAGDILPGGETQKYLSSVVLKLWTTERERIWMTADGEEMNGGFGTKKTPKIEPREQKVGFLIEHSKVSAENISGEFTLCLEEHDGLKFADTEEHRTVFAYAQKKGLIYQEDGFWVWNGQKFSRSQKSLLAAWQADPQAYGQLQREILS